ncbi:cell division protein DrpB [Klebsiella pneumoniae]|nr:cell division protein DrpB [Klebsiella pneumoniae]
MRWKSRAKRSPGGKLALWALYAFCGCCVWVIVRYWWVVGKIHSVPGASVEGDFGTAAGKWLGALLRCMLVLGGIGSILGAVVTGYTRPSRGEQDHQR